MAEKTQKITMFCPHCGEKIDKDAEICPKCGVRIKAPPASPLRKDAILAGILSFLIIGLGQLYNGEPKKCILFFIIGIIAYLSISLWIGYLLLPLFWIYNVFDAYDTAKEMNK